MNHIGYYTEKSFPSNIPGSASPLPKKFDINYTRVKSLTFSCYKVPLFLICMGEVSDTLLIQLPYTDSQYYAGLKQRNAPISEKYVDPKFIVILALR